MPHEPHDMLVSLLQTMARMLDATANAVKRPFDRAAEWAWTAAMRRDRRKMDALAVRPDGLPERRK